MSVIVPFHRNLAQLKACLAALSPLPGWAEVIVAADGAVDRCHELARAHGAQVFEIEGPQGPAVARNRAAARARGEILVFIDTDVVASPGVLDRFRQILDEDQEAVAVFGAYDEQPREAAFVSQYRNLAHSFFHQSSNREARTFWAGLGAIRKRVFDEVGGFDERFRRPSVEDIELGYRVTARGHRILLEPSIRGCHLKRWTLRSSIVSDLRDRGIPWTQLILRFGRLDNDLNLQHTQRLAVVASYVLMACVVLAVMTDVRWAWVAVLSVMSLLALNWGYYAFFLRRRGLWFAARIFPLHVVHHLCNGISFAVGSALFLAASRADIALPGALPPTGWTRGEASPPQPSM